MNREKRNNKKLTIVTVNKNNGAGLRRTLQSVSEHVDKSLIECVVVDACSSDASIGIVREFQNIVDVFISEDDEGPYDGMNKGLNCASGQFVYFLNSGDEIQFWDNSIVDILTNQTVYYFHVVTPERLRNNRKDVGLASLSNKTLNHQGVVYSKELLLSVGGFRTDYRIISDFISLWKIKELNRDFVYLADQYAVARYQGGGISSQLGVIKQEKQLFFKQIVCFREGKSYQIYPKVIAILFFLKKGRNKLRRGIHKCIRASEGVSSH
jgi:glycosyltransferase involved in cell wall biosynthesis